VLTFHSGEDRRVKQAFQIGLQEGQYASIATEIIRPTRQETQINPRASSAKLRWAIRAG
jgi:16S rRNA (cytosine1402-N4)-methyltransferase